MCRQWIMSESDNALSPGLGNFRRRGLRPVCRLELLHGRRGCARCRIANRSAGMDTRTRPLRAQLFSALLPMAVVPGASRSRASRASAPAVLRGRLRVHDDAGQDGRSDQVRLPRPHGVAYADSLAALFVERLLDLLAVLLLGLLVTWFFSDVWWPSVCAASAHRSDLRGSFDARLAAVHFVRGSIGADRHAFGDSAGNSVRCCNPRKRC